jgi:3-dehydroquinate dehydratase/shikimate dehydrogenase
MKLCLTISRDNTIGVRNEMLHIPSSVDLIELRIDSIRDLNLSQILKQPRPPVIVTNRLLSEGGRFSGSADEQFDILSQAARLGAEYIDIEFAWGKGFIQELSRINPKSRIIVSYHNFAETPNNLVKIYRKLFSAGAYAVKITTMANDISDNKRMFELLALAHKERRRLIGLCMGEKGQASRILSAIYGGYLTYAPRQIEDSTAPGQVCAENLIKTFSVPMLNRETKIFGLVGNPVSRSKGIYYHNSLFRKRHCNAVYVNFLTDDVRTFFTNFRNDVTGLSVTMPFKEAVIPHLDGFDPLTGNLGMVNTILRKRRRLIGFNTDLPAIVSLLKHRIHPRGKTAIVLGTGGISATMAFAARSLGALTTIMGRNIDKTRSLANRLGCSYAPISELSEFNCNILMNGTSIGMNPDSDPALIPPNYLKANMVVFDAVYGSSETPLIRDAKKKGCVTIPGIELFERQASLQSRLFLEQC